MAEQDQAIHGCLSCSIQEAHSLLDWAAVNHMYGLAYFSHLLMTARMSTLQL